MTDSSFALLGLSEPLLKGVLDLGYAAPTAVQAAAIPAIAARKDVWVSAQTGSGKTAAFVLPLLDRLASEPRRARGALRALILVPTRELALQIGVAIDALGAHLRPSLKARVTIGGVSINPQMMELRGGADVVVATPGRLLDLVERNALHLSAVEVLVIDEADRLFSLGFGDALGRVLSLLPAARQRMTLRRSSEAPATSPTARGLTKPALVALAMACATATACGKVQTASQTKGDGVPVVLASDQQNPAAVAVANARIFWAAGATEATDLADTTVMQMPLGGGAPVTLASKQASVSGIAVDATSVYWTTNSGTVANPDSDGSLTRLPTSGGDPVTLVSGLSGAARIVVAGGTVFFSNFGTSAGTSAGPFTNGSVVAIAVTGGFPVTLASPETSALGIAVDATSVYWVDQYGSSVMKVPIGGGDAITLAAAQSDPVGIAVDAANVYWVNEGTSGNDYTDGAVMRVPITGGPPVTLASNQGQPTSIALDEEAVYWICAGTGLVMKVSIAGGTPVTLASGQLGPSSIAVDETSVYWTNQGTYAEAFANGSVMKLTPK